MIKALLLIAFTFWMIIRFYKIILVIIAVWIGLCAHAHAHPQHYTHCHIDGSCH